MAHPTKTPDPPSTMESKPGLELPKTPIGTHITELLAELGMEYDEIWFRDAPGSQDKAIILVDPKIGDLFACFQSRVRIPDESLLEWCCSNSVTPLLTIYKQELLEDAQIRRHLEGIMPSDSLSTVRLQRYASVVAELAQKPKDNMSKGKKPHVNDNPAINVCAEHAKWLFNKNRDDFFARLGLRDNEAHLFCSLLLLAVYRDIMLSRNGFFATLLQSKLQHAMPPLLSQQWESMVQMPQLTAAQKKTDVERELMGEARIKVQMGLELPDDSMDNLHTESAVFSAARGEMKSSISVAAASNRAMTQSLDQSDAEAVAAFETAYRDWSDRRDRLQQEQHARAASEEAQNVAIEAEKAAARRKHNKVRAEKEEEMKMLQADQAANDSALDGTSPGNDPIGIFTCNSANGFWRRNDVETDACVGELGDMLPQEALEDYRKLAKTPRELANQHGRLIVDPEQVVQTFRFKQEIDSDPLDGKEELISAAAFYEEARGPRRRTPFWHRIEALLPRRNVRDCVQHYYQYKDLLRMQWKPHAKKNAKRGLLNIHQETRRSTQLRRGDKHHAKKVALADTEPTTTDESGSLNNATSLREENAMLKATLARRDAMLQQNEDEQWQSELRFKQQLDASNEELVFTRTRLHEVESYVTRLSRQNPSLTQKTELIESPKSHTSHPEEVPKSIKKETLKLNRALEAKNVHIKDLEDRLEKEKAYRRGMTKIFVAKSHEVTDLKSSGVRDAHRAIDKVRGMRSRKFLLRRQIQTRTARAEASESSARTELADVKKLLAENEQKTGVLRDDLKLSQAATDTARNIANARYSQEQVDDLVRKARKEGEARTKERVEKDMKEVEVRWEEKAANDIKVVGEQYSARLRKRDKMLDRAEEQFDAHRIPCPWQKEERGPRK